MTERRQSIAIAIRAAHRSLNASTPNTRLKRQRNQWDALHNGLHVVAEFISTPTPSDSTRRRMMFAADKAHAVYDDVQYGPNDLELPVGEIHPTASVVAVMKSTKNLLFWREAMRTKDKYPIGHCDKEFATDIQSALHNGIAKDEDAVIVLSVDWTNDTEITFAIDQDGLLAPHFATRSD